jgi:hypothetical protein
MGNKFSKGGTSNGEGKDSSGRERISLDQNIFSTLKGEPKTRLC